MAPEQTPSSLFMYTVQSQRFTEAEIASLKEAVNAVECEEGRHNWGKASVALSYAVVRCFGWGMANVVWRREKKRKEKKRE